MYRILAQIENGLVEPATGLAGKHPNQDLLQSIVSIWLLVVCLIIGIEITRHIQRKGDHARLIIAVAMVLLWWLSSRSRTWYGYNWPDLAVWFALPNIAQVGLTFLLIVLTVGLIFNQHKKVLHA